MKKSLLYLIILTVISIACKGRSTNSDDSLIYRPANDPELEVARQKALDNFDQFIQSYNKNVSDTNFQFSVKADFVENKEHEHMWVVITNIKADSLQGYLGNEPDIIKNVKYGDFISLPKSQIEDWMIYNFMLDSMSGGYSVEVLNKDIN